VRQIDIEYEKKVNRSIFCFHFVWCENVCWCNRINNILWFSC